MNRAASSRAQQPSEAGFSMVEVLASIAIFAIVAAGLAASTLSVIRANALSRDIMTATSLIEDRIEQFRALNMPDDAAQLVSGSDTVDGIAQADRFTRRWAISDGPTWAVMRLDVTVSWNSPEPQSVSQTTYLCRTNSC